MPTQAPQPSSSRLTSRLPDTQNIISFIMSTIDRIADAPTRQRAYNAVFRFSYQRPVVSSFLAAQLLFALFPLACFIGFTISTVLFIVTVAVGVGMFWVGVAGVVLFWTLVLTFTLAAFTWLYLALCFIAIRWFGRVTGYIETPSSALTRSGSGQRKSSPQSNSSSTKPSTTKAEPNTTSTNQSNGTPKPPIKSEPSSTNTNINDSHQQQQQRENNSSAIIDDPDDEEIIDILSAEQPADTMRQYHIQQIKDGIRRNSIERMDAGRRGEFMDDEA